MPIFYAENSQKSIAENCDQNIGPWSRRIWTAGMKLDKSVFGGGWWSARSFGQSVSSEWQCGRQRQSRWGLIKAGENLGKLESILSRFILFTRVARYSFIQHTKTGKIYKMTIKYTKRPWKYQQHPLQDTRKFTQIGIFGFEIIPSGNPVIDMQNRFAKWFYKLNTIISIIY
jgi:hypothetical protein